MIHVYTDASFAPYGDESHGCTIVAVGQSPLFWRAGKQSTIALSTAESELNEIIEGMIAGESVGVVLEELVGPRAHMSWTDSQSGLSIMTNEGGSWSTRHLRTRAVYARQAIQLGSWSIGHIPGEVMVADIGAKALSAPRLESLKTRLNIKAPNEEEEEKKEAEVENSEKKEVKLPQEGEKEKVQGDVKKAAAIVRALMIVASIKAANGQDEEMEEEGNVLSWVVMMYTLVVMVVTILVWLCLKEGVALVNRRSSSDHEWDERSPPRTPKRRPDTTTRKKSPSESRKEDEIERPPYLPTPTQSPLPPSPHPTPSSVPYTPTQTSGTPVMVWAQPVILPPNMPELPSWNQHPTEAAERQMQSKGKKGKGKGLIEEGKGNRAAAASSTEAPQSASQRQMGERSRAPQPDPPDEAQGFPVFTTKFGKAYHRRRSCEYLTARRTGEARQSGPCATCAQGSGITNATIWMNTWGSVGHVRRNCPDLRMEVLRFSPCTRCSMTSEGSSSLGS